MMLFPKSFCHSNSPLIPKSGFLLLGVFFLIISTNPFPSEPNSYEKKAGLRLDGHQLGEDFTVLRKILSESRFYRRARLYGPDVGQLRDHRKDILRGSGVTLGTHMLTKNLASNKNYTLTLKISIPSPWRGWECSELNWILFLCCNWMTCELSPHSMSHTWRECPFCLLCIQSNREFCANNCSSHATQHLTVCVVAVGFCRVEPRQWTPAPGTSEEAGLHPNPRTVYIKYRCYQKDQSSFPLPQLLRGRQRGLPGGFSQSQHPGHSDC